jgi:hypothetical protein
METFALTILQKEEKRTTIGMISMIFKNNKKESAKIIIKEVAVLHDFERVVDLLHDLSTLSNSYIGIKKIVKVAQPMPSLPPPSNHYHTQLLRSYYLLL